MVTSSSPATDTVDPSDLTEREVDGEPTILVSVPESVRQRIAERAEVEGVEEELEEVEAPEARAGTPAKKPARAAAQEPEKPAEKPAVEVDPAVAKKAAKAADLWDVAEQEIESARARTMVQAPLPGGMTDGQWEALKAKVKKEVAEAEDFGVAAEKIFDEMRLIERARAKAEKDARWQQRMATLEEAARSRYPDFDEVMEKSGLWDEAVVEVAPGQYRNPILAHKIWSQVDPPDTAYWLAKTRLGKRAGKTVEDVIAEHSGREVAERPAAERPEAGTRKPAVERPAAERPAADRRSPEDVARETRRETLEGISRANGKPRGLRGLPSAGEPVQAFTRKDLDRLMESDPDSYLALVEKNRRLDEWHMSDT